MSLYNSPPPAMKMKTKISSCIYLYLADGITHRTHLWMHCVGLGLINTYNVVGNQASRSCVIIGEHFGLQNWTKSLPPRCVSVCVCLRGREKEQDTPTYCTTLYAIILKHMDRQLLCHYCKNTFDMVWYRGANKRKSTILLTQCQPVTQPSRLPVCLWVCMNAFEPVTKRNALPCQSIRECVCLWWFCYTVQCNKIL